MCVRISLPLAGIAVGLSVTAFARIKIRSRQADEYSQKNEHIKGRLESCRYSAVYDMECAVINGCLLYTSTWGDEVRETTLGALLPEGFGPSSLPDMEKK